MKRTIPLDTEYFRAVNTLMTGTTFRGRPALRVVRPAGITEPDIDTYARVRDLTLRDGDVTLRLCSRLLPDAPAHARGFAGLVFRADRDDAAFEGFYVRPTNGRSCPDPDRRRHGCQYFAFPGFPFSWFRERGLEGYEAPADIDLDEWITIRAELRGARAAFYINGTPALTVPALLHGGGVFGGVGIFVDVGTECFVSELSVTGVG